MSSAPVRIGFLGAGLIATYHSQMLTASGAEVVRAGVFDPDRERAESFAAASGHQPVNSEEELIDGCDAVYICTWTSEHARQLQAAVEAGRHVFCEKPLAFDAVQAAAMAATADAAGVTHQVGLVLRHSPAYLWARHLAHDPAAGKVMSVVFRDDQFIPVQGQYASTWRAARDKAGAGTLLEHSIHDVDMLRFLVGEVSTVSAYTANFHGHDGIEDVATAVLRFADGAMGTLNSVWHDNLARPSLRRVELFCARRQVVIEGHDWFGPVSWIDSDGTEGSLSGGELVDAVAPLRGGAGINPDGDFVRAVQQRRAAAPDLHTAVAAHRVVDAIYASAAAGGAAVTVPS